jgi:hypothetical protein
MFVCFFRKRLFNVADSPVYRETTATDAETESIFTPENKGDHSTDYGYGTETQLSVSFYGLTLPLQ